MLSLEGPDAILLLLALALFVAWGGKWLPVPAPVLLAITGVAAGVFWHHHPALPRLALSPDRVLLVFLPLLLTRAAYGIPLTALRRSLVPVSLLAIGLVLASGAVAAGIVHIMLPAVPWTAAVLFGAILAPPDPVAITSVAGRIGLPHRLVTVLEGEGLLNDAIAIVGFDVALAATVSHDVSLASAMGRVLWEAPAGAAVGFLIGWGAVAVRRRMDAMLLEAAVTLLLPFVAYRLAERIEASGVLAAVMLGLILARKSREIASPAARIGARVVWNSVDFAITTVVFLLVGMELGFIGSSGLTGRRMAIGAAVAGALFVVRMAWMHTVPQLVRRVLDPGTPAPSPAERTIMGWAGIRGVVSMALTLAIPTLGAGRGADDLRTDLVVVSAVAILCTLVVQGVTLLPVVRLLGQEDPGRAERDEAHARVSARAAALAALGHAAGADAPARARHLRALLAGGEVGIADAGAHPEERAALERSLEAQRDVVWQLRAEGRLSETLAASLETELDGDLLRLRGDISRLAARS